MRYLIVAFVIIMLSACENTRHSIGISGKPLATGERWKIVLNLITRLYSVR